MLSILMEPSNLSSPLASLQQQLDALGSAANSRLFTKIVESTGAAIGISDIRSPDQPLIYVNSAFEALTGYSAAYAVGKNCRFLQNDDRQQADIARLREAVAAGRSTRVLLRNYRRDGSLFWNDLTLAPMRDAEGVVSHYFSICFDVSASVAKQANTEKLMANWRALLDVSMGPTFVVDMNGAITFESDAAAEVTGEKPGVNIGRHWFDGLNIIDRVQASAAISELLQSQIESVSFDVAYRNTLGSAGWLRCRVRNALAHPHIQGLIIAAQDVTNDRMVDQLAHDATHDALTRVFNRHYLRTWYSGRIRQETGANARLMMWLIDLDQFKALNDSYGHSAGDDYLRHYAQALQSAFSSHWNVARLGGDEFAIIGESETADHDIVRVSREILTLSRATYPAGDTQIALSASIGVATTSRPFLSFDELMRNADIAMYVVKRKGRNDYETYDADKGRDALERNALLRDLSGAISRDEFRVAYHAIVDAHTRQVMKFESLLRWNHPQLGMLVAHHFVNELSLTGMCEEVTLWVLEQSLRQHHAALASGATRISLNVWARSFRQRDFALQLISAVRARGLAPSCLEVEIVETEFVMAERQTTDNLAHLGENGVRLIIDDFGKGFSNLSYLQRLNVQGIKIDSSFIWNIGFEKKSEKLIRGLLALARDLGLEVVGEGVETEQQRQFLLDHGCELHQGFLYGRPNVLAP
jgi:diguanylate cyclase (GGDEF)-like protein/PAS domain S-box-containing protein